MRTFNVKAFRAWFTETASITEIAEGTDPDARTTVIEAIRHGPVAPYYPHSAHEVERLGNWATIAKQRQVHCEVNPLLKADMFFFTSDGDEYVIRRILPWSANSTHAAFYELHLEIDN